MSEFKLTVEEANVLDKIAEATKMDGWFHIDENLHVHDIEEPDNPVFSDDAGGVRLLEDGLAYGLDKPQSGGLSPEEIRIAEACFKRARAALPAKRVYKVPVVFEMYGTVEVEASSAEEAYDKVRDNPDDYTLPDDEDCDYVDGSFRVADDDRDNAVDVIEMLGCTDDNGLWLNTKADPDRHTGLTVKATVTFQRWEGDVARFNGEAEFDACDALDSMDDEMIALVEQGDPNAYDAVYYAAVRLGQIHGYDGPFEVDLDEDNLSDYLEARYPLEDEKEGE